jgi:CRISPR-associated protein Csb3
MATATIPVDLTNPGQVFACLGFMEAAGILCGPCTGRFGWSAGDAEFSLRVAKDVNPIEVSIDFACASATGAYSPPNFASDGAEPPAVERNDAESDLGATFPSAKPENMALPVRLSDDAGREIFLSHWADGSSRDTFKLYAGNRSALKVVKDMQELIKVLRRDTQDELVANPMNTACAIGGSFNFDARGAWNALDAGYSPDRLGHSVQSSPVVELFAAVGLQNARPVRISAFEYYYYAWGEPLPLILARTAIASVLPGIPSRRFRLPLFRPNPNSRAVAHAQEEFAS